MIPTTDNVSPKVSASRKAFKKISRVPVLSDLESSLPSMKPIDGTEIRYTKFPECHYPEGATPAEITKHSLDHSFILLEMLKNYEKLVLKIDMLFMFYKQFYLF